MSKVKAGFMASSIGTLFLVALGSCSNKQHPLDHLLSQIKPIADVSLRGLEWSQDTLLCPLTPYQSALSGDSDTAQRVNLFLKGKQFQGDESHWSLVVVRPALPEAPRIEHIIFERGKYDVVTALLHPDVATAFALKKFQPKECVKIQEARILATHGGASNRTQISFGTAR